MIKSTDIGTRRCVELRPVDFNRGKMIDDFLLNAKRSVSDNEIEDLILKKSGLNR